MEDNMDHPHTHRQLKVVIDKSTLGTHWTFSIPTQYLVSTDKGQLFIPQTRQQTLRDTALSAAAPPSPPPSEICINQIKSLPEMRHTKFMLMRTAKCWKSYTSEFDKN